jgi:hypothetical protein
MLSCKVVLLVVESRVYSLSSSSSRASPKHGACPARGTACLCCSASPSRLIYGENCLATRYTRFWAAPSKVRGALWGKNITTHTWFVLFVLIGRRLDAVDGRLVDEDNQTVRHLRGVLKSTPRSLSSFETLGPSENL